jgi:hypothetical protein
MTLYSVFVVHYKESFDMYTITSHALADATSLINLHNDLILFCDYIVQNIPITDEIQPLNPGIDPYLERSISSLKKELPMIGDTHFRGLFAQLPTKPTQGCPFGIYRFNIPHNELQPILTACHNTGITLHSLLVASFALAIRELSRYKSNQILMRSSIDLRRRVTPPLSKKIFFTAVTGHNTYIEDLSLGILNIAKWVMQDIRKSSVDGTIFEDFKYTFQLSSTRENPIALNISNLGIIELSDATYLKHQSFEYAAGSKKTYPVLCITINPTGLKATITYINGSISAELVKRLCELAIQSIKKIPTI